jgi:hypothetical protein
MVDIKLEDYSDLTIEQFESAVLRGLEACGMVAETYAKQECPVDTGRLRNSIAHTVDESEKAAYIGTNVEYGPYIEYGHHSYGGHHMLKNAASNHTDEYKRIIEDSLKNA